MSISTYCGNYPDDNHLGCPSSVECMIPSMEAKVDEIRYMVHNACGEAFEQDTHNGGPSVRTSGDVKRDHHKVCEALRADALAGKSWKMNLTEDEAF